MRSMFEPSPIGPCIWESKERPFSAPFRFTTYASQLGMSSSSRSYRLSSFSLR